MFSCKLCNLISLPLLKSKNQSHYSASSGLWEKRLPSHNSRYWICNFWIKKKSSKHTWPHTHAISISAVWRVFDESSRPPCSNIQLKTSQSIIIHAGYLTVEACKSIREYNRLLLLDYLGLFHLNVGTTVVKPDKKYYHNYLVVGFARAHFLVLKLSSLQATLFWSSRWRWFPWCHRRPGRKWSMTFCRWCVWSWFPRCSLWWDFISTRRLMLRNLAKRKQKIRRARKNEGKKIII